MTDQSLINKTWYTGNNEKVNLAQVVKALAKEAPLFERVIHVGTDAQRKKKRPGVNYVTVVAIHNKGKGATGFYTKVTTNKPATLQEKLFQETWYSLEVALALCEIVPQENIFVHIDANPDARYESSRYHNMLRGMVTGQGFRNVISKPYAWAASHAADNLLKSKSKW